MKITTEHVDVLRPFCYSESGDEDTLGDAFIETASGKRFWPLSSRSEHVDVYDIATALSNQCRYSGHVKFHWSVAAHSVYVAALVRSVAPEHVLAALLHDASEAYLVDLPRPIKYAKTDKGEFFGWMTEDLGKMFCFHESGIHANIMHKFGLSPTLPDIVHYADHAMLWYEANALMRQPLNPWWGKWKHWADRFKDIDARFWVRPMTPERCRILWLTSVKQELERFYQDRAIDKEATERVGR